MPSPLEQVAAEAGPPPRVFVPQAAVRLCRAVLSFKALLDADADARGAGRVPLATATEVYFATHFTAASAYQRLLGFYASVASYQAIAVCRAVARFLHLLPGEDLSTEALQLYLDITAALSSRDGSGGARAIALSSLYPSIAAATGSVGGSGGGADGSSSDDAALNAPGVAGSVVREQLRASGASAPLVECDACAEVMSAVLSGGRMPPADVGLFLVRVLNGSAARTVRIEEAPSRGSAGQLHCEDGAPTPALLRFLVAEEAAAAAVDAWSATELQAHRALRHVVALAGAWALVPPASDEDIEDSEPYLLPCEPGSAMAALQSVRSIPALSAISSRDACNVAAMLLLHAAEPGVAQLQRELVAEATAATHEAGCVPAAVRLLCRLWRLAALFVSYDPSRRGLVAPWVFAVLIAASGLYKDESPAHMYAGLSAALRSFATQPSAATASSSAVFSGSLDRSAGNALVMDRYLHSPPAGSTTSEALGSTAAEPAAASWPAVILRARPELATIESGSPVEGRFRRSLLVDPTAAALVDYGRFWAVLYGLVLQSLAAATPMSASPPSLAVVCERDASLTSADVSDGVVFKTVAELVRAATLPQCAGIAISLQSSAAEMALASFRPHHALPTESMLLREAVHVSPPSGALVGQVVAGVETGGGVAAAESSERRMSVPIIGVGRDTSCATPFSGYSDDVEDSWVGRFATQEAYGARHLKQRQRRPAERSHSPLLHDLGSFSGWGAFDDDGDGKGSDDEKKGPSWPSRLSILSPGEGAAAAAAAAAPATAASVAEASRGQGTSAAFVDTPDLSFTQHEPHNIATAGKAGEPPAAVGESSSDAAASGDSSIISVGLATRTVPVASARSGIRHRRQIVMLDAAATLGIPSVLPGPQQLQYDWAVELLRKREARAAELANEAAERVAAEPAASGTMKLAGILKSLFSGVGANDGWAEDALSTALTKRGVSRLDGIRSISHAPVATTSSATGLHAVTALRNCSPRGPLRGTTIEEPPSPSQRQALRHTHQLLEAAQLSDLSPQVLPPPTHQTNTPASAAATDALQQRQRAVRYKEAVSALLADRELQRRQAMETFAIRRAETEELARLMAARILQLRAAEVENAVKWKRLVESQVAEAHSRDVLSRHEAALRARRAVLEPSPVALARKMGQISPAAASDGEGSPHSAPPARLPPVPPFRVEKRNPALEAAKWQGNRHLGLAAAMPSKNAVEHAATVTQRAGAAPRHEHSSQSPSALARPLQLRNEPKDSTGSHAVDRSLAVRIRRSSLPRVAQQAGVSNVPAGEAPRARTSHSRRPQCDAPERLSHSHRESRGLLSNGAFSHEAPSSFSAREQQLHAASGISHASPRVSPRLSFAGLNSSRRGSIALLDALLASAQADVRVATQRGTVGQEQSVRRHTARQRRSPPVDSGNSSGSDGNRQDGREVAFSPAFIGEARQLKHRPELPAFKPPSAAPGIPDFLAQAVFRPPYSSDVDGRERVVRQPRGIVVGRASPLFGSAGPDLFDSSPSSARAAFSLRAYPYLPQQRRQIEPTSRLQSPMISTTLQHAAARSALALKPAVVLLSAPATPLASDRGLTGCYIPAPALASPAGLSGSLVQKALGTGPTAQYSLSSMKAPRDSAAGSAAAAVPEPGPSSTHERKLSPLPSRPPRAPLHVKSSSPVTMPRDGPRLGEPPLLDRRPRSEHPVANPAAALAAPPPALAVPAVRAELRNSPLLWLGGDHAEVVVHGAGSSFSSGGAADSWGAVHALSPAPAVIDPQPLPAASEVAAKFRKHPQRSTGNRVGSSAQDRWGAVRSSHPDKPSDAFARKAQESFRPVSSQPQAQSPDVTFEAWNSGSASPQVAAPSSNEPPSAGFFEPPQVAQHEQSDADNAQGRSGGASLPVARAQEDVKADSGSVLLQSDARYFTDDAIDRPSTAQLGPSSMVAQRTAAHISRVLTQALHSQDDLGHLGVEMLTTDVLRAVAAVTGEQDAAHLMTSDSVQELVALPSLQLAVSHEHSLASSTADDPETVGALPHAYESIIDHADFAEVTTAPAVSNADSPHERLERNETPESSSSASDSDESDAPPPSQARSPQEERLLGASDAHALGSWTVSPELSGQPLPVLTQQLSRDPSPSPLRVSDSESLSPSGDDSATASDAKTDARLTAVAVASRPMSVRSDQALWPTALRYGDKASFLPRSETAAMGSKSSTPPKSALRRTPSTSRLSPWLPEDARATPGPHFVEPREPSSASGTRAVGLRAPSAASVAGSLGGSVSLAAAVSLGAPGGLNSLLRQSHRSGRVGSVLSQRSSHRSIGAPPPDVLAAEEAALDDAFSSRSGSPSMKRRGLSRAYSSGSLLRTRGKLGTMGNDAGFGYSPSPDEQDEEAAARVESQVGAVQAARPRTGVSASEVPSSRRSVRAKRSEKLLGGNGKDGSEVESAATGGSEAIADLPRASSSRQRSSRRSGRGSRAASRQQEYFDAPLEEGFAAFHGADLSAEEGGAIEGQSARSGDKLLSESGSDEVDTDAFADFTVESVNDIGARDAVDEGDTKGSVPEDGGLSVWLAGHPSVLAYAALRAQDPSLPRRSPSDIVNYLTAAPFLHRETQRQAGIKAAAGQRFDLNAFPLFCEKGTSFGGSLPAILSLLHEVEKREAMSAAALSSQQAGRRSGHASSRRGTRLPSSQRSARVDTASSGASGGNHAGQYIDPGETLSNQVAGSVNPRPTSRARSVPSVSPAEALRHHEEGVMLRAWQDARKAVASDAVWLDLDTSHSAGFQRIYAPILCQRDRRLVVVLRPTQSSAAEHFSGPMIISVHAQLAAHVTSSEPKTRVSLAEKLMYDALDRHGGRWEDVAAEMVAFEPDHRKRIRALRAFAKKRSDASVERLRDGEDAETSAQEALQNASYPSTPRSDRELASPPPDVTRSTMNARSSARDASTAGHATFEDVSGASTATNVKSSRLVHIAPLVLSGTDLTFDAQRIAVDSEPTLLWNALDRAVAVSTAATSASVSRVSDPRATKTTDQTQAFVSQSRTSEQPAPVWGAGGYAAFPLPYESDPLMKIAPQGLHQLQFRFLQVSPPASSTDESGGDLGEDAPLRDSIFKLFNDSAAAELQNEAAVRAKEAGEAAAKKAAAAVVAAVLEEDLLSKPLQSFTTVVWRYAVPWDEFLAKSFESTFGVTSCGTPTAHPSAVHAEPPPPEKMRFPDSAAGVAAELAVLGSPFLRSPPSLIKKAADEFAVLTSGQHAESLRKQHVLNMQQAVMNTMIGCEGGKQRVAGDLSVFPGTATQDLVKRARADIIRQAAEREPDRTDNTVRLESEASAALDAVHLSSRSASGTNSLDETVQHLAALSEFASHVITSTMRKDRLLLAGLERLLPSYVTPLNIGGDPAVAGAVLKLKSRTVAPHCKSGAKAVYVGWRYFRAVNFPAGDGQPEPDLVVSARPLWDNSLPAGSDYVLHAQKAEVQASGAFLDASQVPPFSRARPLLSWRVFASTSRLPTTAEHEWESRPEASEAVLANARDLRATLAAGTEQRSDLNVRCVHIRPSDSAYIRSSALGSSTSSAENGYFFGVRIVLQVSLPLPPGVALPSTVVVDVEARGTSFIDPLRYEGAAPSSSTRVDAILARLQQQVQAMGGLLNLDATGSDHGTGDEETAYASDSAGGPSLSSQGNGVVILGDGPLALWHQHDASCSERKLFSPRSAPWTESWLSGADVESLPRREGDVLTLKRKPGRFAMKLGDTPMVIERASPAGTLRRMRLRGTDAEIAGSDVNIDALRDAQLHTLKRIPGEFLRPQLPRSESSAFGNAPSSPFNAGSSPRSKRGPIEQERACLLRRSPSLPLNYFRSHSRPPNGDEAIDEVVVGLLPLQQDADDTERQGSAVAAQHAKVGRSAVGGPKDVVRVRWHVQYDFHFDPLLDGPDVKGAQEAVSTTAAPAALSGHHIPLQSSNSSRDLARAYNSLMKRVSGVTEDDDDEYGDDDEDEYNKDQRGGAAGGLDAIESHRPSMHPAHSGEAPPAALVSPGPAPSTDLLSYEDGAVSAYFDAVAASRSHGLDLIIAAASDIQARPSSFLGNNVAAEVPSQGRANCTPLPSQVLRNRTKRGDLGVMRRRRPASVVLPPALQQVLEAGGTHHEAANAYLSPELAAAVAIEGRIFRRVRQQTRRESGLKEWRPRLFKRGEKDELSGSHVSLHTAPTSPTPASSPNTATAARGGRALPLAVQTPAPNPCSSAAGINHAYFRTGPEGFAVRVPLPAPPPRLDPLSRSRVLLDGSTARVHASVVHFNAQAVTGPVEHVRSSRFALLPLAMSTSATTGLASSVEASADGRGVSPGRRKSPRRRLLASVSAPQLGQPVLLPTLEAGGSSQARAAAAGVGTTQARALGVVGSLPSDAIAGRSDPTATSGNPIDGSLRQYVRRSHWQKGVPRHARRLLDAVIGRASSTVTGSGLAHTASVEAVISTAQEGAA